MRWILAGGVVGLAAALIGLAVFLTNRSSAPPDAWYPQSTPDEVLQSALMMIERGDAHRLSDLLYADSDEMRSVLNRLGRLLGSVQSLGATLQKRFPDEVAELRKAAEENSGKGGGALAFFTGGGPAGQRGGGRSQGQMNDALRLLLADPYGWLERGRGRLSTIGTADNAAAIMVDGKPAFGLGLTMRRDQERWRIVLPLNMPVVSKYTPRTHDEYAILASMIQVFDNAVIELDSDVRAEKARDIEAVAERAGEKAWMPLAMCFVAYQKAMEARERPQQGQ